MEVNEVGKDGNEDQDDEIEEWNLEKLETYNEACEYLEEVKQF